MLNIFRTSLRTLLREKGFTLLNVLGLSVGIATALLIASFIRSELAWDTFHEHYDRIWRVDVHEGMFGASGEFQGFTPAPLGPAVQAQLPQVQAAVRAVSLGRVLLDPGERGGIYTDDALVVDSTFFRVFSYPMVRGNPQTALATPEGVVLTEETARRLYGDRDPLGRTIMLGDQGYTGQVTGVVRMPEEGTHLTFDALLPTAYAESMGYLRPNWFNAYLLTYVLLDSGADPSRTGEQIQQIVRDNREEDERGFLLTPLSDLHLYTGHIAVQHNHQQSDITYVWALGLIALFILIIAGINYVNLSTSRSLKRAREVGLRKVVGATRGQLVAQYLGESVLLTLFAVAVAAMIAEIGRPFLENLARRTLPLSASDPATLLGLLALALFLGMLAGLYPAFFLARFQPSTVLRGSTPSLRAGGANLRRALVILQFAISIVLIVGTVVVYRQLDFLRSARLGYEPEQALVMYVNNADFWDHSEHHLQALRQVPGVTAVSATWNAPTFGSRRLLFQKKGSDDNFLMDMYSIDEQGAEALGLEMARGRFFSGELASDTAWSSRGTGAVVINETAARELGWEDPIGRQVIGLGREGTVVGVVKDFHQYSLHRPMTSVVMMNLPQYRSFLVIRVAQRDMAGTLEALERRWGELMPDVPFDVMFLDRQYAALYATEERMAHLLELFSGLAIFIASLGLVGLAAHATSRRVREIGVRKVLGAGEGQIVALVTREFLLLVLAANLIAWPVAWFIMHRWLEQFAYRSALSWWLFPLAGVAALMIALVTISWHALRAARTDPAKVLRTE